MEGKYTLKGKSNKGGFVKAAAIFGAVRNSVTAPLAYPLSWPAVVAANVVSARVIVKAVDEESKNSNLPATKQPDTVEGDPDKRIGFR